MFNLIEQLFAPGRKHTEDENKRLELSRVDLNDGDPGRGPIDLDSGTVIIRSQDQSPHQNQKDQGRMDQGRMDQGQEDRDQGQGRDRGQGRDQSQDQGRAQTAS
ncbi:hypothetical protein G3I19_02990 [Streptomyces sp. SID10853]|uniref:DUF6191 domain-containing protein n=1 Tax=Streptomyces sp. SID10853 TaxID=2706028 RepID=UPI0013C17EBB|nr:DUF6191 domain-containing protein [Streptomyces sp. SID10853]NDZ77502.1 hypothetical protein [Streptomyces sp. SID10853]